MALLAGGYLLAAARDRRGWSRWRIAAWLSGCALLAVAVSPLLARGADPVTHMGQHLLLGMLAPVGLVLGAPVTLLLRTVPRAGDRSAGCCTHHWYGWCRTPAPPRC